MAIGAHFTPSLLDAETLERLFVNRHHHLDDAMGRIERAARSGERAAKLFVGPRGAGKTHLISLVYHRAKARPGFGGDFQLAWLPEDMWTVSSLDDLAAEIVDALEPAFEPQRADPVAAIVDAARLRGPIVVLIENLDSVLDAIGGDGQRQLRALMENHRPLLLIATATRLGEELLGQAEPFYGFFDTTTLEPFDVDDAARMLKRIAEVNGDTALAARLDERRAKNRLATVAHLAGGQPRVWALLGSGLTIERLDDLVSALVERFDDLTPYYQQQLDRLSLNERRAVRALAAADGSLSVSELAERTGIEPRSLAKTITDLRRQGWIVRRTGLLADLGDKRRSYYQLAEPLARLAFQLKEARGRPVKLVVEFLKAWFDDKSLSAAGDSSPLATSYREAAHQSMRSDSKLAVARVLADGKHLAPEWPADHFSGMFHPDPRADVNTTTPVLLQLDDAIAAFETGDPEPLLREPPAVSNLIERQILDVGAERVRLGLARLGLGGGDAGRWVSRLEPLVARPHGTDSDEARGLLALHQLQRSAYGPADVLLHQITANASEGTAPLLLWLGETLLVLREPQRACAVLEAAKTVTGPASYLHLAVALYASYQRSGHGRKAIKVWEKVTDALDAALGPDHPDTLTSRNNFAYALDASGDFVGAISAFEAVLADRQRVLGPDHPGTLTSRNNLASAYSSFGDLGRAIPLYESTLVQFDRILGPDHPDTLTARNNLAAAHQLTGDLDRATHMFESILEDRERVLGSEHPDTLGSRNNLATAHQSAGNLDRAISMYKATLAGLETALGRDHPATLSSRNNLASAYQLTGDLDQAIPMYEETLASLERVLGRDHRQTRRSRENLASAIRSAAAPGISRDRPTGRFTIRPNL